MKVVIQRVSEASVQIDGNVRASIGLGFLVFLGIHVDDSESSIPKLAQKISNMRIFSDEVGLMNKSLNDVNGDILLISQFTLYADTKKGNRPSFLEAAKPETAVPLYEKFILELEKNLGKKIFTGVFGADMKVGLLNDGPVTIILVDPKE
jgi:D-tyrosyl-tRNA(Tyr) deacylase